MYGILAGAVVLVHLAFILFVLFGGLLALRWKKAPLLHVPAFLWGGYVELSGRVCPLTPLENALRRAGGAESYSVTFIEQYLLPIVYPPGLTRDVQLVLAGVLVVVNVAAYGLVLSRRRARVAPTGSRAD